MRLFKHRLLSIVLAAVMAILAAAPAYASGQTLVQGMYGTEVYEVQQQLYYLGYMVVEPDGGFGAYTTAALKIFQAENGLDYPDGMAGNWTRTMLSSNPYSFYNLSYGMSGPAVVLMQQALIGQGYLNGYDDGYGYFGDNTYYALQKYQFNNSLSETGVADLYTLTMLIMYTGVPFRTLSEGMSGQDVSAVQDRLYHLGYYYGGVTGYYDSNTKASMILFQAQNGLEYPDGMAGRWTYNMLINPYAGYDYLEYGDYSTAVLVMQRYLAYKGYLKATPDGYFGNMSYNAVRLFQIHNGLDVTGVADLPTQLALYGDSADFRTMKLWDEGTDVLAMQKGLYNLGYLTSYPDGTFGRDTYGALCAFQAAGGIAPDGSAGAWTMNQIASGSAPYFKEVNSNSSYNEIYYMEKALSDYGALDSADGVFDWYTTNAIKTVQSEYGLPETGTADIKTLSKIYNLPSQGYTTSPVQWYSSATNWLLYVNLSECKTYVYYGSYGNWKLKHEWICSPGAYSTPTVTGEFTVSDKGYSFGDGYSYTCYYYTRFYGDYLFHSTLYQINTFIPYDGRLGANLSHGCVRLAIENAKWIYENIPSGTKVVVTW